MRRTIVGVLTALGLLVVGWSAGRAQSAQPDFVLLVDSPDGRTTVHCVRGCELVHARSADIAKHLPSFTYTCGGKEGRCSSQEIAGWLTKR